MFTYGDDAQQPLKIFEKPILNMSTDYAINVSETESYVWKKKLFAVLHHVVRSVFL